ncbi:MAG: hypothetical protein ACRDWI_03255 [Jiangellaceae bacterium]
MAASRGHGGCNLLDGDGVRERLGDMQESPSACPAVLQRLVGTPPRRVVDDERLFVSSTVRPTRSAIDRPWCRARAAFTAR